jgi:hypothetical protein
MISLKGAHFLNIVARPDQREAGPLLRRAAARDMDAITVRHILRRHHRGPAPQRRKAGMR